MSPKRSVELKADFEGANISNSQESATNYFTCQINPDKPSDYVYPDHHCYWFYLKMVGVRGRTITVDLVNCDWMPRHWKNYTPVYRYASNPGRADDLDWRRIEQTHCRRNVFGFTHRFLEDKVYVALRYPYMYSYQQTYLRRIEGHKFVERQVWTKTGEGRSLDGVLVTDPSYPDEGKKGIWICAREHGVEQDGSWVCQGMIDFLLSDAPEASALRKRTLFVFIPILSPDAVYYSRCVNPETGYCVGLDFQREPMRTREARAVWERVQRWVGSGHSLDICISFHNPHGSEPNLWPFIYDHGRRRESKSLNKAIMSRCRGYTHRRPVYKSEAPYFPNRCAKEYGSLGFIYEINHQAKGNFLTLEQLRGLGEGFCKGIYDYYGFGP